MSSEGLLSAKLRAEEHRREAKELERAGYPGMAMYHREMAEWLDPPPRIREREARRKEPVEKIDCPRCLNNHKPGRCPS